MSLPLAHLGHWWSYILYAVPLAVVIGAIVVTKIEDRREAEREDAGTDRGGGEAGPRRPAG